MVESNFRSFPTFKAVLITFSFRKVGGVVGIALNSVLFVHEHPEVRDNREEWVGLVEHSSSPLVDDFAMEKTISFDWAML